MYLRGWRVFYTVRLQKTLWNLHLDIGSQHNCFANSLQCVFTGATGFSPYSLMEDLIFGHGKKQASKKALNKHPAELQKCPVPILTWTKFAQFRRGTRITAKVAGCIPGRETGSALLVGWCKEGKGSVIKESAEKFSHLAKKCGYCLILWLVHSFWDFLCFKLTFGDSSETTVIMWDQSCLVLLATCLAFCAHSDSQANFTQIPGRRSQSYVPNKTCQMLLPSTFRLRFGNWFSSVWK